MCNLIIALVALSLIATYRYWSRRSLDQSGSELSNQEKFDGIGKKDDLPGYAILNTSKGPITVELFKDASPEVSKGHFKGMPFSHVIKHYIIKGGGSQELGAAEDWISKGKLRSQLVYEVCFIDKSFILVVPKHEAFMLGTTKARPDNKGFELVITTAPIPDLNDKLIVFGREIEEVDTDEHYRPKSSVGITGVILKQEI
ncbi:peptidyl-prolyl cis-trans isomerase CYP21-3 [Pyrus ussuriensis x Pyrus communis]|uniref:Peptidyl-prolyl cis-trans isomerase CYP21-3 n=1 Tax=Pyrus ussuriensis x Pyrus communis TaxID=2448454 RepID=A0A5N5HC32_9ROSA|nr:peptidyl-prolyl cis-trans isomerase CYP21-3 [Pyrus ussuriensis x Pyrus communis]